MPEGQTVFTRVVSVSWFTCWATWFTCWLAIQPATGTGVPYYILQGIDKTQDDEVILDERISGFTIRVSWRSLHEEGFAWLDGQVARGDQLDRDVQIRVMAGGHAPPNLAGVDYFLYPDDDFDQTGEYDRAPVPWNPDLPGHMQSLATQLGTRYGTNPRVKFVHFPGFADSSEMHTPDEIEQVPGYSSSALAQAWVDMSQPWIQAFPNANVSLNYATPSQANLDSSDSEWVLQQILAAAGSRAAFQANDLSAAVTLDRNKYQQLIALKEQGNHVGYQMVSISSAERFGGAFEEAVSTGLAAGAEWLEIYSPDLPNLPLSGDYNFDGVVDAADYTVWRNSLGEQLDLRADGTGDHLVNVADYEVWKQQVIAASTPVVGQAPTMVPEPVTLVLALGATMIVGGPLRRHLRGRGARRIVRLYE